jgi:hypothetical protein
MELGVAETVINFPKIDDEKFKPIFGDGEFDY